MTIFRAEHNRNYTVVNNHIITDKSLSFKAKAIWLYAFSRPDNWMFRESDIINQSTDGKTAVRAGIKELQEAGYLVKEKQKRKEDGTFTEVTWVFYETPDIFNKFIPQSGFLPSDNEPLLSTEEISTEKYNVYDDSPDGGESFAPRCEVAKQSYDEMREAMPTISRASASVIAHQVPLAHIRRAIKQLMQSANVKNPVGLFRANLFSLQQAQSETLLRSCGATHGLRADGLERGEELAAYCENEVKLPNGAEFSGYQIIHMVKVYGFNLTLKAVRMVTNTAKELMEERLDIKKLLEIKINELFHI